jgi:hypothetical protein
MANEAVVDLDDNGLLVTVDSTANPPTLIFSGKWWKEEKDQIWCPCYPLPPGAEIEIEFRLNIGDRSSYCFIEPEVANEPGHDNLSFKSVSSHIVKIANTGENWSQDGKLVGRITIKLKNLFSKSEISVDPEVVNTGNPGG